LVEREQQKWEALTGKTHVNPAPRPSIAGDNPVSGSTIEVEIGKTPLRIKF